MTGEDGWERDAAHELAEVIAAITDPKASIERLKRASTMLGFWGGEMAVYAERRRIGMPDTVRPV